MHRKFPFNTSMNYLKLNFFQPFIECLVLKKMLNICLFNIPCDAVFRGQEIDTRNVDNVFLKLDCLLIHFALRLVNSIEPTEIKENVYIVILYGRFSFDMNMSFV